MHHRGVLVAIALVKQPREIRVQALVVAHDARFKIVETTNDGQEDYQTEEEYLASNGGDGFEQWAFKPVFCFFVHRLFEIKLIF